MADKQVRWHCPNSLTEGPENFGHPAVLAPTKPRRDDVRRYCLECSRGSGRLVKRVPRVLEKKRETREEARRRRTQERRARERAKRDETKRAKLQEQAADYAITFTRAAGGGEVEKVYDNERVALRNRRRFIADGAKFADGPQNVKLWKIQAGWRYRACFDGRKFKGWEICT